LGRGGSPTPPPRPRPGGPAPARAPSGAPSPAAAHPSPASRAHAPPRGGATDRAFLHDPPGGGPGSGKRLLAGSSPWLGWTPPPGGGIRLKIGPGHGPLNGKKGENSRKKEEEEQFSARVEQSLTQIHLVRPLKGQQGPGPTSHVLDWVPSSEGPTSQGLAWGAD